MTAIGVASLPRMKVPIWRTTKAAYRDTFGNLGALVTAAAVPFALSLLIDLALPEQQGGAGLLRLFLSTLVVALFELAWLRHLLLGREARPRLVPRLDRRLRTFIGYSLLLTLLTVPALLLQTVLEETSLPVPEILIVAVVILYAVGSYLWVRFGFVFLWIALDARERLGDSWRSTRSNGLRILIVLILVGLPLLLPLFGFGFFVGVVSPELGAQIENSTLEGAPLWVLLVAGNALLYLYYALSCAVVVGAFGVITGWLRHRNELLERFE